MTVSFTDTLPAPLKFDTGTLVIANETGTPMSAFSVSDTKPKSMDYRLGLVADALVRQPRRRSSRRNRSHGVSWNLHGRHG